MVASCFNKRVTHFDQLPVVLGFESYAGCNLSCKMCGYSAANPDRPFKKHLRLEPEKFSTILEGISQRKRTICLSGRGEPLLHPGLEELVAQAARKGHSPGFYCNGTLMTEARSRSLLSAGLDWIFFSVDGAEPATFESIRVGARHEEVMRNIGRFADIARSEFHGKCQIMINCTLSKETLPERDLMIAFWKEKRLPVRFTPLVDWYGGEVFSIPEEMQAQRDAFGAEGRKKRYPCNILWTRATFDAEGNYECCYRPRKMDGIPSIYDVPIAEVWREYLGDLRRQHLENRITSQPCASCPWWSDRREHIPAFDRMRMFVVDSGYIRMDRLLAIWNAFTRHRPISVM